MKIIQQLLISDVSSEAMVLNAILVLLSQKYFLIHIFCYTQINIDLLPQLADYSGKKFMAKSNIIYGCGSVSKNILQYELTDNLSS